MIAKWSYPKLAEICEVNPRRPEAIRKLGADHQVTFVPMPAVDQYRGEISAPEIQPLEVVRKGFTYFEDEDVIFAKITPCMQNGKSAIARDLQNGLGFGSTEFHVLRSKGEVLPEWIWYFVRQGDFRREAKHHFQGAVGQQRVPAGFLENSIIPLPPPPEQRRIVGRIKECMERVEEIERLQKSNVDEASSLMTARRYDLWLECERAFEMVALNSCISSSKNGLYKPKSFHGSGTLLLRMFNIKEGFLNLSRCERLKVTSQEAQNFQVKNGDIIVSRVNSRELVGKSALVEGLDEMAVNEAMIIRISVNLNKADGRFLVQLMNSPQFLHSLRGKAKHAIGQSSINQTDLLGSGIPLPDLNVQRDMVESWNVQQPLMASIQAEVRDSSVPIRHLGDAILRKAFAGEL